MEIRIGGGSPKKVCSVLQIQSNSHKMSEKTTEYEGIAVDFAKLQQELFDQVRAFFADSNFNSFLTCS
jgi:hypothetical protein